MRELVARRQPLYRFVLDNVVSKYDLDRADGRVDATRERPPGLGIRDRSKVEAFAREIVGQHGSASTSSKARAEVRRAANRPAPAPSSASRATAPPADAPAPPQLPDLRDPRFALEREALKLVVQEPVAVASISKDVGENDFTHPTYRAVWTLVEQAGGIVAAGSGLGRAAA